METARRRTTHRGVPAIRHRTCARKARAPNKKLKARPEGAYNAILMSVAKDTGEKSARRLAMHSVEGRMNELGVPRWPLTAIGILLFFEAAGLATAGTLNFTAPAFEEILPSRLAGWGTSLSVLFLLISPLALVAGVGFMRLWSGAWLAAMLLQGLSLAVSLAIYFYLPESPFFLFLGMAYSTLMVLYLNSHGVRASFRPERKDGE